MPRVHMSSKFDGEKTFDSLDDYLKAFDKTVLPGTTRKPTLDDFDKDGHLEVSSTEDEGHTLTLLKDGGRRRKSKRRSTRRRRTARRRV